MPIHDWTRVEAGIFHAFHHSWIEEMARALNGGLLPGDYYALAEQCAAGFEPQLAIDVPLETTYQSAFAAVPRRWRRVLEA